MISISSFCLEPKHFQSQPNNFFLFSFGRKIVYISTFALYIEYIYSSQPNFTTELLLLSYQTVWYIKDDIVTLQIISMILVGNQFKKSCFGFAIWRNKQSVTNQDPSNMVLTRTTLRRDRDSDQKVCQNVIKRNVCIRAIILVHFCCSSKIVSQKIIHTH